MIKSSSSTEQHALLPWREDAAQTELSLIHFSETALTFLFVLFCQQDINVSHKSISHKCSFLLSSDNK